MFLGIFAHVRHHCWKFCKEFLIEEKLIRQRNWRKKCDSLLNLFFGWTWWLGHRVPEGGKSRRFMIPDAQIRWNFPVSGLAKTFVGICLALFFFFSSICDRQEHDAFSRTQKYLEYGKRKISPERYKFWNKLIRRNYTKYRIYLTSFKLNLNFTLDRKMF